MADRSMPRRTLASVEDVIDLGDPERPGCQHGLPVSLAPKEHVLVQLGEQDRRLGARPPHGEPAVYQQPLAERVHRADVELRRVVRLSGLLGGSPNQGPQSVPELQGGFFSERGKENFIRRDMMRDDEIDDPPQEDSSFSRTWARDRKSTRLNS